MTEDSFISQLRNKPDALTLTAFADWCEEQGWSAASALLRSVALKRPYHYQSSHGSNWQWHGEDSRIHDNHIIPQQIYAAMGGMADGQHRPEFRTQADALAALYKKCVEIGRGAAQANQQ